MLLLTIAPVADRTHIGHGLIGERGKYDMTAALDMSATAFGETDQPFLSARLVAERLGLPLTDLASLIGVARTTLTARSGARKVDSALSPLVRIIAMAAAMAGDEGRAAIWFKHQPLPGWGGKTAMDLVREGKGAKVLDYLESVRAGVYS